VPVPVFRGDATVEFDGGPVISIQADPLITVLASFVESLGWRSHRMPEPIRRSMTSAARWVPVPLVEGFNIASAALGTFDAALAADVTDGATFTDRLEQVRGMSLPDPDATVVAMGELDPGMARRWSQDSDGAMADYCGALTAYWREVVQPHYPQLEQRLRREAERWRVGLEEYGADTVLNLLHPQLRSDAGSLRLEGGRFSGTGSWSAERLVLKPIVATPATYLSNIGAPQPDAVRDAHFAAPPPTLRPGWNTGTREDDSLVLLLGRPRASILRSLSRRPGTTTDLADEFGLTPATVSHHLGVLTAARVLDRNRRGTQVWYRVNDRGRLLTTL
jgi:Bacterial regulatory protein, arsR family